jgi:hypothetical protein
MLRSILDIARSEGENLRDPEAALACIEVFGLGGRTEADDTADVRYFVVRDALARSVAEAARFIAERGVVEEGAPVLVRLIAQVSARFRVVITQKAAAQAIPLIGALGGAAVNYAFVEHFQTIARGHFTVRRLERSYGEDLVRATYERLSQEYKSGEFRFRGRYYSALAREQFVPTPDPRAWTRCRSDGNAQRAIHVDGLILMGSSTNRILWAPILALWQAVVAEPSKVRFRGQADIRAPPA